MGRFGILGAGSQARELADYLRTDGHEVAFMAVDAKYLDHKLELIDIATTDMGQLAVAVLVAVGAPRRKREMAEKWAGDTFATFISKNAWVSSEAEIGEGTCIAPNATVTVRAKLGRHVLVNINASISHDVEVGDFTTFCPGSHVGGNVRIGRGVFVGIGAAIKNGIEIADGVTIGAGAIVTESITQENAVVIGNPARTLKVNEGWMDEI